jgi:hypothetical protein
LLSHYDPADFEDDVKNYEARKADNDPVISVHYFRLSRILRDLLFTCSSIDYGFEISKQSRAENPNFAGVRLYDLNQSMLTPLWKGAGMPYVRVSHGSDTNYIFNGLFPEGEVSEADQKLSEEFSRAFIRFAYTGNPNPLKADPEDWPEAFPLEVVGLDNNGPKAIELEVIGDPYGTGSAFLSTHQEVEHHFAAEKDGEQQILPGVKVGAMGSAATRLRKEELEHQKLLQRCVYVNSLTERLGI